MKHLTQGESYGGGQNENHKLAWRYGGARASKIGLEPLRYVLGFICKGRYYNLFSDMVDVLEKIDCNHSLNHNR